MFPEYFYSFLHGYFRQFSITMQLTPDKCIQKYGRHVHNNTIMLFESVAFCGTDSMETWKLFWLTYCWTEETKIGKLAMEVKCLGWLKFKLTLRYFPIYIDALVIILSAITSHLRLTQVKRVKISFPFSVPCLLPLQFASSKLQALEMMKRISHHISDECILERTVPYLVR